MHIYIAAETAKSQTRKPKCSKGYHCSRNAYMLVYKRQTEEIEQTETIIEVPGNTDWEKTLWTLWINPSHFWVVFGRGCVILQFCLFITQYFFVSVIYLQYYMFKMYLVFSFSPEAGWPGQQEVWGVVQWNGRHAKAERWQRQSQTWGGEGALRIVTHGRRSVKMPRALISP